MHNIQGIKRMAGLKEWPDSYEGRTKTKAGLRLFHHQSSNKKIFWNLMCHWGSRDPRSTLPTTHQNHTLQSDKNFLKKTQRVQPEKNLDKWERNPETKLARTIDQGGLIKSKLVVPWRTTGLSNPKGNKSKTKEKTNTIGLSNPKEKNKHNRVIKPKRKNQTQNDKTENPKRKQNQHPTVLIRTEDGTFKQT